LILLSSLSYIDLGLRIISLPTGRVGDVANPDPVLINREVGEWLRMAPTIEK
jgi:hypothetical protein